MSVRNVVKVGFLGFVFALSCLFGCQNKPVIGYGKLAWGTDIQTVMKKYADLKEVVDNPEDTAVGKRVFMQGRTEKDIRKRVFSFYNNKLYRVDVVYDETCAARICREIVPAYVSAEDKCEIGCNGEYYLDYDDGLEIVIGNSGSRNVTSNSDNKNFFAVIKNLFTASSGKSGKKIEKSIAKYIDPAVIKDLLTDLSDGGGNTESVVVRYADPAVEEQIDSARIAARRDIKMVFVQGGTFTMGCTEEQGNECGNDEKPAHEVTLGDFYIGTHEVTQGLWKLVMGFGNNPSILKGDYLPVTNVSWSDVQEIIAVLKQQTGKNYRLPTEAEWEFAARGGNKSKGFKYSGSNSLGDVAWYWENSGSRTHYIGTKSPNELGIHDMSGNVYEWVNDWYGASYYSSSSATNPAGSSIGYYRVLRGGSGPYGALYCRVSYRSYSNASSRGNNVGFRLAVSP